MSDSRQVSDSQVDDSLLNQSPSSNDAADFLPDTSRHFEAWLENLKPKLDPNRSPVQPVPLAVNNAPAPGELRFEGTLRIDCYVAGLLRSLTGTLMVSQTAELESDVFVATAIIDGLLRGNIQAAERVELRRHAMVIGNIESPSLAIQPGAIFEGQCHFLPSPFELAALNSVDEDNRQAIRWMARYLSRQALFRGQASKTPSWRKSSSQTQSLPADSLAPRTADR